MDISWFRSVGRRVFTMATAVALLSAVPSAAQADGPADLEVESYVLPLGSATLSLEELQSDGGMQRLRNIARNAEPIAQLPHEPLGPAAS